MWWCSLNKYAPAILLLLVLVAPFVVRGFVGAAGPGAGKAAGGDAPELVIVTPHNQDIRRVFERAFSDWHQRRFGKPVRITYLTPGGTNDIVRFLNDIYDAQRDRRSGKLPPEQLTAVSIDLVWGGGDTTFDRELKPLLKPVAIDPALLKAAFPSPDLNGVALYERMRDNSPPKWVGVVLSSFGIIYNPSLYRTLDLPQPAKWEDVARPELAGLVALTDPTRSGSAAVSYMMVIQRAMADAEGQFLASHPQFKKVSPAELAKDAEYQRALSAGWKQGMRTLLLMAANARYFTDSGSQPCHDVGNGEAAAGVAIDFFAKVYEEQVGQQRIRYIAPQAATAITPDPIAVLYGVRGDREILANRFIEFLISPEGQRLWDIKGGASPYVERSLRRLPIRRDVYANRDDWADDVNPFEQSGGFNMRQEWMRLFSDTRPIWAAAWIDSRSALVESYRTILGVSDRARRERLLFELSDLPVEMSDVAAQAAKRSALQSSTNSGGEDPRLWMTRQRVNWARKFREHYQAVAGKVQ